MNFNDKQLWASYDPENQAKLRIATLQRLIPKDTKRILDVGCGNGLITNQLAKDYYIEGIDPSLDALEQVSCPKQQASITAIPYTDNSFDLVMCHEVLEHLNDLDLERGARELKRVSSKFLIISVPHREQLAKSLVSCAKCGHKEHVYGHLQSFDLDTLTSLFSDEYLLVAWKVLGPLNRDYPFPLLKLKQSYLRQWWQPEPGWYCPVCGGTDYLNRKSIFTKAVNTINKAVSKSRPYWLMTLYKAKDHPK